MRKLVILGSTGSIGKNTLEVIRRNNKEFKILALSAANNIKLLKKQIDEFSPKFVTVWDKEKALRLKKQLNSHKVKVLSGLDGIFELALLKRADMIVFSMSGMVALKPLLSAIENGKDIAIANKELLVIAGEIIMKTVRKKKINFIPIDSEHSAIFQCLQGHNIKDLRKIILTASGGPFLRRTLKSFVNITKEEALNHPKWRMGKKISIDSATMMNKGLEIIEASFLYGISVDKIDVIIHPQSIIHSLVEFKDGAILAQLSSTDMYFPISYAVSYPKRLLNVKEKINLADIKSLDFERPDFRKFSALKLAYKAAEVGGTMPTVLSAANEVAVNAFLEDKIRFLDIIRIVKKVMNKHTVLKLRSVDVVLKVDTWAKKEAEILCRQ